MFFFSSRRRHTRLQGDWSSDVCSSDLNRLTSVVLVEEESSWQLRWNYLFLRRIESALRRIENKGVSKIPPDEVEQARLAKRLGFGGREEFFEAYSNATRQIRALYDRLMKE